MINVYKMQSLSRTCCDFLMYNLIFAMPETKSRLTRISHQGMRAKHSTNPAA